MPEGRKRGGGLASASILFLLSFRKKKRHLVPFLSILHRKEKKGSLVESPFIPFLRWEERTPRYASMPMNSRRKEREGIDHRKIPIEGKQEEKKGACPIMLSRLLTRLSGRRGGRAGGFDLLKGPKGRGLVALVRAGKRVSRRPIACL